MKYYKEYKSHRYNLIGKRKVFDDTIYSFDIETTSYIRYNGKIYQADYYQELDKKEQEQCEFGSNMYIWQLGINEDVYYGRYWYELIEFLDYLNKIIPERKIIFVHNLAFEFQYLKSYFRIKEVTARKSHKVMKCTLEDYNIELRCTYMMSNCSLKKLPELFNLPVEKLVGDLDYRPLRTSETKLTEQELHYCENDCLVVYHYIRYELQSYENLDKIPMTSTGHVRNELKDLIRKDFKYKRLVSKSVNTDPHVYNLLIQAFMGGYTHANYIYTDRIVDNVDSWDFTSSYPYVLVTHKFPATKFKRCRVTSEEHLLPNLCYLLVVKLTNVKSKYYNNFLSFSKCREIHKGKYDNGRVMEAESLITTLTDIDFKLIRRSYECDYEILECYYSVLRYLPTQFINFVLDKYVMKTKYKGVPEKALEYNKQKSMFNSLYGMSVTNNIRDEVKYDNVLGWEEIPLTNEEIEKKLIDEEKIGFMSFATGVFVTSYARWNLLTNIMKLDPYVIYADTDSLKLAEGYDKNVILDYNKKVEQRIKFVSELLHIPMSKYAPKDIKGKERMLGLFDDDGHYEQFITQGAKKYAVCEINPKTGEEEIHITVSGVPKSGAKCLNGDLNNFKDDLVFTADVTNKNLLFYCEGQLPVEMTDKDNNTYIVDDKSGCCVVPTTYVLSKSYDYMNLLSENSSRRAIYKE